MKSSINYSWLQLVGIIIIVILFILILSSCATPQNLPRDVGNVEIIKIVKVTDKYTIYRIKESDGNKSNYIKTDKKYNVGDVVEAYPHKDYYHNQWY